MGVRKRKRDSMEEEGRPPIPLLLPTTTTKRRSATPDHPPYSEMVQVALRSLSEKEGSTLPSISSFILSTYSGLPWAHSRLLPYYLRKLLLAGDISMPYPSRFSTNPPQNPNNASGPVKIKKPPVGPPRRGRPRKYPIQMPSSGPVKIKKPPVGPPRRGRPRKYPIQMPCSTRPKLILRLKRRKPAGDDDGDGGGGRWICLLPPPPPPPTVPDTESGNRSGPTNHGRI